MSERYDYSDVCCAEGPPVTERNPATAPSGMASRSILKATHTPDAKAVYGIALMILLAALALASTVLSSGCASAKADLHAASSAAVGILTVAANSPELLDEAKVAVTGLAGMALSPVDQALVAQALGHVTSGNAGTAAAILAPVVAASAGP